VRLMTDGSNPEQLRIGSDVRANVCGRHRENGGDAGSARFMTDGSNPEQLRIGRELRAIV
jgi:hypothetical protein